MSKITQNYERTKEFLQFLPILLVNTSQGRKADYLHSSAYYYISGEQGFYPVTNYAEVMNIDLTK